jgi:hypothetical protein
VTGDSSLRPCMYVDASIARTCERAPLLSVIPKVCTAYSPKMRPPFVFRVRTVRRLNMIKR